MTHTSLKAIPYIVLVGSIYGSNMVIARFSLGQYAPLTLVALRLTIAALVYCGIYLLSPSRKFPRDKNLWIKSAISGLLSTVIPLSGFIAAMQYISSGLTGLLDTLVPVFVIVLAHFVVDEKMSWQKGLGTLIAFLGTAFLWFRGESGLAEIGRADWRGYAFALFAVLSAASGILYARYYLAKEDTIDVSAMRMICAALIIIPLSLLVHGFDLSKVNAVGYGALIYLSLIGTLLAFLLDLYIVQKFGATAGSQVIYVIPCAAILLGMVVLGEKVTPAMLFGLILIFIGIVLINRRTSHA